MDRQPGWCEKPTALACRINQLPALTHTDRRRCNLAAGSHEVTRSQTVDACCVPGTVLAARKPAVSQRDQRGRKMTLVISKNNR